MLHTLQQRRGHVGEQLACRYLKKQGLRLVKKNYRVKSGEIDLIMQDKETLVFVEVRYRTHADYGSGIETITAPKRKRIIAAAKYYLLDQCLYDKIHCRFDVMGIDAKKTMTWIKNAFTTEGESTI